MIGENERQAIAHGQIISTKSVAKPTTEMSSENIEVSNTPEHLQCSASVWFPFSYWHQNFKYNNQVKYTDLIILRLTFH